VIMVIMYVNASLYKVLSVCLALHLFLRMGSNELYSAGAVGRKKGSKQSLAVLQDAWQLIAA